MANKRFSYVFVGMRPSEREEVSHLLAACQDLAELTVAETSDLADFWVLNGDDAEWLQRGRGGATVQHMLIVGGEASQDDGLLRLERPFDLGQARQVLEQLMVNLSAGHQRNLPVAKARPRASWADHDSTGFSEFAADVELTPSELAMTEDEPWALRMARRTVHLQRMARAQLTQGDPDSIRTLDPSGMLDPGLVQPIRQPAQLLLVTNGRNRTRTLPKGLRRMGFEVDVVEGLPPALQAMAYGEYRMVFLDQGDAGSDLRTWYKAFLQSRNKLAQAPDVVVIARRKTLWARWRAMRAGCAAWMSAPLNRKDLLAFLLEREIERTQAVNSLAER